MRKLLIVILISMFPASTAGLSATPQSLADVARKEADRRRKLEQQGVVEKRIEETDHSKLAPGGAISTSSVAPVIAKAAAPAKKAAAGVSLRTYQTRLQKLDREIVQLESQLKRLRARAEAERKAPPNLTKAGSASGKKDTLGWQILEMEDKLKVTRQERMETYQEGRKAGFLPGELENRGIVRD